jgi:hypothetical protein
LSQTAFLLSSLLTGKEIEKEHFKKVYAMYGKFIGCHEQQLHTELLNYRDYRFPPTSSEDRADKTKTSSDADEEATEEESSEKTLQSQSMLDALTTAPGRFPNVQKLLRIAVTMPLTSCSAERCFSAMKILKSRLRSTMDDERLNGLALLYIHKDKEISLEHVINNFALSDRKLDFVL